MRLSERWLRTYVDPAADSGQLVHQLTMAGLEVDSAVPAAPAFSGVVVAEVEAIAPHPQADRLKVCQVGIGAAQPLQIVCGAPNVAVGMRAPLAVEGARLPGGMAIGRSKLRGVESQGMLCSAKELGLEDSASGLLPLPVDAPVGQDFREYLDLDDQILEVDLTPNRADCLSVEGIAREVAVLFGQAAPEPVSPSIAVIGSEVFPVAVTAPEACPRYLGRIIRNIRGGVVTPLWMKERLRRSGVRSLDPVVDVTNYVLLELGQPLHAFDLARLKGAIEVRFARAGDRLTLLNDQTVEPDTDTLVIADRDRPLALAGIMGGRDSAVTAETRDLFVECAFFAPTAISGRARRYGLATESSHRFERGVDPELQMRAIERCTQLIIDLVGGEPGPVFDVSEPGTLPVRDEIVLRADRVEKVLGLAIDADLVESILRRLSMQVSSHSDGWRVRPPSFRFDITREIDLIEEVGRVYGYDRIPQRAPMLPATMQPATEHRLDADRFRDALVDRGYQEAITYSFVEPTLLQRLEPDVPSLAVKNPISAEMAVMRTTLWAGLLDAALKNQARQESRVRLFEVGAKFINAPEGLQQPNVLAGLAMGPRWPEQWSAAAGEIDFFDIKGDLEAMFMLSGRATELSFVTAEHPALHPGQTAAILIAGQRAGCLGMLHPALQKSLGFGQNVFLFELELAQSLGRRVPRFTPLSKFPRVRRDLAVVVDEVITSADVVACVRAAGEDLIRRVVLFDVYQGTGIADGKKSIAFGLILQADDETLTDARVDQVVGLVMERLTTELAAELRA
ncbi:phenylalanine--tRNA ligase subunit beta [Methylotetracoccus oryzae]|uniref:phenylalanine--tRNA ligase subunit beta n=1 Tax=Methylotetracoccus oryzae TaxID=1919059 RepID=UPI001118286E|nr:phenylalanine--tRNA ligase subunit beta [Methylotetracoccus oryzae]